MFAYQLAILCIKTCCLLFSCVRMHIQNLTSQVAYHLFIVYSIRNAPLVDGSNRFCIVRYIFLALKFLVEGWCIGRFGLFGTHVQAPKSEPLNICGLVLSIASGFFFVFVQSDDVQRAKTNRRRGISQFFSKTKCLYVLQKFCS